MNPASPESSTVPFEGAVKILHLSDLHFGSTFDPSLWEYVGKVLAGSDKPNVVVVTGDLVDSPSFFMLALARNELKALVQRWCGGGKDCELLVIPGNHDIGILGNYAGWPWRSKFAIVFSKEHAALFDRLPTYSEYTHQPLWWRCAQRLGWIINFAARRLLLQLNRPPPGPLITESANRALCFASFDSNGKAWLASGHISSAEISQVHGELLQRRVPDDTRTLLNLVPRIALVHHHVVAIPYSSALESLTNFEPFLVLRNAGTLLRELCYWDFDLVLHGHKHLLNFVRLTFDSADQPRSELAVLAAGSATKRQPVSGQNSFNLIKVFRSGVITFRSVRYGEGSSGTVEGPWNAGFQSLLPLREVKLRAHARAGAGQEMCADSAEYGYTVNESGSAQCHCRFRGLQGMNEERLRRRQLQFSVSYGAIAARSIQLDADSERAGHVLTGVPTVACKKSVVQLHLTRQRVTGDIGTDYGVHWHMVNSFATSLWECAAMGQGDGKDWISVAVRFPTKRLKLVVQLPKTFRDPSPQLLVRRCTEYPLMIVTPHGDIATADDKKWEIEPDWTELEKSNIHMSDHRCEVDIEYPLVGHRYELRWRVDTEVTTTTSERRGQAMQIRDTLLTLAKPNGAASQQLASHANDMLQKVTQQLLKPLLGSKYALDEQLECALFIYDDVGKSFRLVAAGRTLGSGLPMVKDIPLNAGISGAAFKHRGVSLFISPSCAGSDDDGAYIYFADDSPDTERPEYAALLAIPLHLGDLDPEREVPAQDKQMPAAPEEGIGIFTIATTAKDNQLLSLPGPSGASGEQQLQKHQLVTEIWAVAVQYFRGLGDAVRTAVAAP
jgi:hypothetical protein